MSVDGAPELTTTLSSTTARVPAVLPDGCSASCSRPAVVTEVSVTVRSQVVGSAWPSTQVLKANVEPTTRKRTHCLARLACAPVAVTSVVWVALTSLRSDTEVEFEVNSSR